MSILFIGDGFHRIIVYFFVLLIIKIINSLSFLPITSAVTKIIHHIQKGYLFPNNISITVHIVNNTVLVIRYSFFSMTLLFIFYLILNHLLFSLVILLCYVYSFKLVLFWKILIKCHFQLSWEYYLYISN